VDNHATKNVASLMLLVRQLHRQQMNAIPNSNKPVASIKCEKAIPITGSGVAKNFELPNELQILATPVMKRITPKLKTSRFGKA
jgi:hypothetical protein